MKFTMIIWLFVLALFLTIGTGCSSDTDGIYNANKDCYRSSPYFDKEKCRDNALNQKLIPAKGD